MTAPNERTPTHFYDTVARAISCGLRRPEDHSTKHARSVTCPACIARRDGASEARSAQAALDAAAAAP